jgi:DNA repair protein RadA/Sms
MAKARVVYRCSACGATAPAWVGRCAACEGWNTLIEERSGTSRSDGVGDGLSAPQPIGEVDLDASPTRSTGVGELDRVLGGGLVPGSVTLLGGEPGVGKSTLLLQVSAAMARDGGRVLYVSAEESARQVRLRAERLDAVVDGVWLVAEGSLPAIVAALDDVRPDLVVVDSIQTVHDPDVGSAPGAVAQVRAAAHRLVGEAKRRGCAVVLVGHVTKDGGLAGPRELEHVVDTVLAFEGDRHHALRLLRAVKHRFGPTQELGLFEMREEGLAGLPDPSGLFLGDRRPGVCGSVVVPTMEGSRPLLVELQALVTVSALPSPRRSAQGLDGGRLSLLVAVLQQSLALPMADHDIYALAVGGVRIVEPAADLAVVLAIASSLADRPLDADIVACGEVGLGGELRQVAHTPRRLAEATRLGFTRAVLPLSAPEPPEGMTAIRAGTVAEALAAVDLLRVLRRFERRSGERGDRGHGPRFGQAGGNDREDRWLRPVSPGAIAVDGDWPDGLDPDEASGG